MRSLSVEAAAGCRPDLVGDDATRGWRMEYGLVAGCYASDSPGGPTKSEM